MFHQLKAHQKLPRSVVFCGVAQQIQLRQQITRFPIGGRNDHILFKSSCSATGLTLMSTDILCYHLWNSFLSDN